MARYCPDCGERVQQGETFCAECGGSLESPSGGRGGEDRQPPAEGRGGGHQQGATRREETTRRETDSAPGDGGYGGGPPGDGPPRGDGYARGPSEPLPRLGAIDTFSQAFSWVLSVPILIGAFLVADLLSNLGNTVFPLLGLVGSVLSILLGGVAYIYTARITAGDRPDGTLEELTDAFSEVLEVALSLIGAFVLYGIAVVIGLVLLVLPGIYLGARLSLAFPAIVLDDQDAIEGLSTSWEVADGNVLKLVGIFVIQLLAFAGAALVVGITGVFLDEVLFLLLLSPVTALLLATVEMAVARVYLENHHGTRQNRQPAPREY